MLPIQQHAPSELELRELSGAPAVHRIWRRSPDYVDGDLSAD